MRLINKHNSQDRMPKTTDGKEIIADEKNLSITGSSCGQFHIKRNVFTDAFWFLNFMLLGFVKYLSMADFAANDSENI